LACRYCLHLCTMTSATTRRSAPLLETAAITATITAAFALTLHICSVRRDRRLAEAKLAQLNEQRMAERTGRIRAEVKLRTLMKNESGSNASSSNKKGNLLQSQDGADDIDNRLVCIGKVVSPFTKRMGCPRQGALVPNARGYIQLSIPEQTVEGMDSYSHAWIIFAFHANTDRPDSAKTKIRPPRAPKGTKVGMLATRSPHRPNNIGLSLVKIVRVDAKAKRLHIAAFDLVNGTPVYDIKPVVAWDIPGHHDNQQLQVPSWVSQEDALQKCEFSSRASSELTQLVARGSLAPLYTEANDGAAGAKLALGEVLAQDPRASSKRGSSTDNP